MILCNIVGVLLISKLCQFLPNCKERIVWYIYLYLCLFISKAHQHLISLHLLLLMLLANLHQLILIILSLLSHSIDSCGFLDNEGQILFFIYPFCNLSPRVLFLEIFIYHHYFISLTSTVICYSSFEFSWVVSSSCHFFHEKISEVSICLL